MRLSTPVLVWAGLSTGRFSSGNVVLEDGKQESRRVGSLRYRWKLEKGTAVRICVMLQRLTIAFVLYEEIFHESI